MNIKEHWEKVYDTKQAGELSWYQPTPLLSLELIKQLNPDKNAAVIDIGGGDSLLVDHLLNAGYTDITVLDISAKAINRAKIRLGEKAEMVNWIIADVLELKSEKKFNCWHDRAAFHFFTTGADITAYTNIAGQYIKPEGKLIISTFSTAGPDKCSGLPVKQYDENRLSHTLEKGFSKIKCIAADHITPLKKVQQFLFCSFQKINK